MIRFHYSALVAIVLLGPIQSAIGSVIRAVDVLALPSNQQGVVVVDGLKQRAESLHNVVVDVHVDRDNVRIRDGKIVETVQSIDRVDQTIRRIGDSQRFDRTYFQGDATAPLYESKSGYNATSGVSRMWATHSQMKKPSARIATQIDPVTRENWYGFFLSGRIDEFRVSFLQHLLDNADKIVVASDAQDATLLVLTVDQVEKDGGHFVRKYWVCPEKGYPIVRMEHRWQRRERDGSLAFDERDWTVDDMREVKGVWMPTKIHLVGRSQHVTDVATVYDIEVRDIKIGELTEADLFVDFPPGTEVNDMINQKLYEVGKEDKVRTYAEGEMIPVESAPPESPVRYRWLIVGNVIAVVAVGLALLVRRFVRRRSSEPRG